MNRTRKFGNSSIVEKASRKISREALCKKAKLMKFWIKNKLQIEKKVGIKIEKAFFYNFGAFSNSRAFYIFEVIFF